MTKKNLFGLATMILMAFSCDRRNIDEMDHADYGADTGDLYDADEEIALNDVEAISSKKVAFIDIDNGETVSLSSDEVFRLVTWNIENFPLDGVQTVDYVSWVISNHEFDIVAVQEIKETGAFYSLLERLPGYGGILSLQHENSSSMLRTGVIYRKDLVSAGEAKLLFEEDEYSFPRAPLEVRLDYHSGEKRHFDFTLIVVHLKAMGGSENEARRRSAAEKIKKYIDAKMIAEDDDDFIIAGDFNDEITDPPEKNVFQIFIDDPEDYRFLTMELAKSGEASYPEYGANGTFLDHILVTTSALDEYNNGNTVVYKLDDDYKDYFKKISDHRPVAADFNVPENPL